MNRSFTQWDHEKFAAALPKEVDRRLSVPDAGLSSAPTSQRVFDQFVAVGPTRHHDKCLIAAYPATEIFDTPLAHLLDYCLPTGSGRDGLRTIDYWILDEFVFQLNFPTGVIYGVCVHVRATELSALSFLKRKIAKRTAICFCLLTPLPTFSTHFNFLRHLTLVAMGKSAALTAAPADDFPLPKPFPDLRLSNGFGTYKSMTFADGFHGGLAWYYRQSPLVPPAVSLPDCPLNFPETAAIESRSCIAWAALDTLFSLLSPKDVLTVVACLLLDGQVLVLGDCLQEVSMTVFALTILVRPFELAGPVVPILPNEPSFLQLLNSPGPFLIGCVLTGALREFSFVDSALFVELDKRRVCFTGCQFPEFPGAASVASSLRALLGHRRNVTGGHPFGFPPKLPHLLGHKLAFPERIPEQIIEKIQAPFAQVTSDLLECFFVTVLSVGNRAVTVFNRELFIVTIPPLEQPFFNLFVESLPFQLYVEQRIRVFLVARGQEWENKPPASSQRRPRAGTLQKGRPRTKSINRMPNFSLVGPDSD
jgi:hypothetical protein